MVLNDWGVLNWDYWWWSWPFVPLIVVFGYLWFFLFAGYVFDRPTNHPALPPCSGCWRL